MIIDDDVLTDDEKSKITEYIVDQGGFPIYRAPTASKKIPAFSHTMVMRDEQKENWESRINSIVFKFFYDIFCKFCEKHNIKCEAIYRAAINVSFAVEGYEIYEPHVDHSIEHKNFILYLNDLPESDGKKGNTIIYKEQYEDVGTVLLNLEKDVDRIKELTILNEVCPKLGRILCFGGNFHNVRMPPPGCLRYACIITFC